jgi:hypothetical protein
MIEGSRPRKMRWHFPVSLPCRFKTGILLTGSYYAIIGAACLARPPMVVPELRTSWVARNALLARR